MYYIFTCVSNYKNKYCTRVIKAIKLYKKRTKSNGTNLSLKSYSVFLRQVKLHTFCRIIFSIFCISMWNYEPYPYSANWVLYGSYTMYVAFIFIPMGKIQPLSWSCKNRQVPRLLEENLGSTQADSWQLTHIWNSHNIPVFLSLWPTDGVKVLLFLLIKSYLRITELTKTKDCQWTLNTLKSFLAVPLHI